MKKQNNDKIILELKKQVEDKKKLISNSKKFTPITNLNIEVNNTRYNLNVITSEQLKSLHCLLRSYKTANDLDFPGDKLIISGFSVEDWMTDIKSKYDIKNIKTEEDRLKTLENKLHNLLSTDKKVEIELNDLAQQI